MPSSGRLIGSILIVAGLVLGAIMSVWLLSGMREGTLQGSGAVFGLLFGFLILVAPLVGGGIFFLTRGRAEEKASERVRGQRRLLDMLMTRGQLSIVDVALELGLTREQIESDLYDLVGLGLFTGYVDWRKGKANLSQLWRRIGAGGKGTDQVSLLRCRDLSRSGRRARIADSQS
jgi:hypothetical protein